MNEDIGNYAPPSDELLDVLGMRLYDIMNQLCSQMMRTSKDEDYIEFKAHNGITGEYYLMNVSLKKIKE
jgi:hypothetical protein